jgi:hypothetical protein
MNDRDPDVGNVFVTFFTNVARCFGPLLSLVEALHDFQRRRCRESKGDGLPP